MIESQSNQSDIFFEALVKFRQYVKMNPFVGSKEAFNTVLQEVKNRNVTKSVNYADIYNNVVVPNTLSFFNMPKEIFHSKKGGEAKRYLAFLIFKRQIFGKLSSTDVAKLLYKSANHTLILYHCKKLQGWLSLYNKEIKRYREYEKLIKEQIKMYKGIY